MVDNAYKMVKMLIFLLIFIHKYMQKEIVDIIHLINML